MPEFKHPKPCKECPFKRTSMPGWLGSDSPEGFLKATQSESHMPCHCTIDYDDPKWKNKQLPDAPLCAGSLIFLKNQHASPRDPKLREAVRQVERDTETVFQWGPEFIEHHKSRGLHKTPEQVEAEEQKSDLYCWGCRKVAIDCDECGSEGTLCGCGCEICKLEEAEQERAALEEWGDDE